jgi:hypothetical protein
MQKCNHFLDKCIFFTLKSPTMDCIYNIRYLFFLVLKTDMNAELWLRWTYIYKLGATKNVVEYDSRDIKC